MTQINITDSSRNLTAIQITPDQEAAILKVSGDPTVVAFVARHINRQVAVAVEAAGASVSLDGLFGSGLVSAEDKDVLAAIRARYASISTP